MIRPAGPAARTRFSLVLLGLFAWSWPTAAAAQRPATVRGGGAPFLAAPGGTQLGRLAAGARLVAGADSAGATPVTLEGWIIRSSVGPTTRDGYDLVVTRPENLRAAPNGALVGRLVTGALLDTLGRRGAWVQVRRGGWVSPAALARDTGLAAAIAARPADTAAAGADTSSDGRVMVLDRRVPLYPAPGQPASGILEPGNPVVVVERAGGWVRVQASGWVRASDVRRAGGDAESAVTAADIRAHPEAWKGKVLRWTIQFIGLETADELRPDFTPGEHYILARGPAPEYAFLYIVVPPDQLARVQRLQPLDSVTVVARVVKGRSAYLSNPILQLLDIVP